MALAMEAAVVQRVREALARDPRLDLRSTPIRLRLEGGALVAEGEVDDVATKRRCLSRAAAVPGVVGIVDRLRVAPGARMTDGEIHDRVCKALLGEPALSRCSIRGAHAGRSVVLRAMPPEPSGSIEVRVQDGVVTLDGEVASLAHKRLAGVLAWWTPGARDVIDGLGVEPPEEDDDGELADAVALALEKDPLIGAGRVSVAARAGVVELRGAVRSEDQQRIAERDAWYVLGVDEVRNHLAVVRGA